MVKAIVVPRITHEKFNTFRDQLEEISPQTKTKILEKFYQVFDYNPDMIFYSREARLQNKEYHLNRTQGQQSVSDAQIKAQKKYNEVHREEVNRRQRERYKKKKAEKLSQLISETERVNQ